MLSKRQLKTSYSYHKGDFPSLPDDAACNLCGCNDRAVSHCILMLQMVSELALHLTSTLMLLGNMLHLGAVVLLANPKLCSLLCSAQSRHQHVPNVLLLYRCCWPSRSLQPMGTRMRRALWSIGWDSMSHRQSQAQSSCMLVWLQTEFSEAS